MPWATVQEQFTLQYKGGEIWLLQGCLNKYAIEIEEYKNICSRDNDSMQLASLYYFSNNSIPMKYVGIQVAYYHYPYYSCLSKFPVVQLPG